MCCVGMGGLTFGTLVQHMLSLGSFLLHSGTLRNHPKKYFLNPNPSYQSPARTLQSPGIPTPQTNKITRTCSFLRVASRWPTLPSDGPPQQASKLLFSSIWGIVCCLRRGRLDQCVPQLRLSPRAIRSASNHFQPTSSKPLFMAGHFCPNLLCKACNTRNVWADRKCT